MWGGGGREEGEEEGGHLSNAEHVQLHNPLLKGLIVTCLEDIVPSTAVSMRGITGAGQTPD